MRESVRASVSLAGERAQHPDALAGLAGDEFEVLHGRLYWRPLALASDVEHPDGPARDRDRHADRRTRAVLAIAQPRACVDPRTAREGVGLAAVGRGTVGRPAHRAAGPLAVGPGSGYLAEVRTAGVGHEELAELDDGNEARMALVTTP